VISLALLAISGVVHVVRRWRGRHDEEVTDLQAAGT